MSAVPRYYGEFLACVICQWVSIHSNNESYMAGIWYLICFMFRLDSPDHSFVSCTYQHKSIQFLQDRERPNLGMLVFIWQSNCGMVYMTKSLTYDNFDIRFLVKTYSDICVPQLNFTSLSTPDILINTSYCPTSVQSLFLDPLY